MGMGAAGPLEQAMIATSVEPEKRTELFSVFAIAGTAAGSLGALGVGVPDLLQNFTGISQLSSLRAWFIIYPLFLLITVAGCERPIRTQTYDFTDFTRVKVYYHL